MSGCLSLNFRELSTLLCYGKSLAFLVGTSLLMLLLLPLLMIPGMALKIPVPTLLLPPHLVSRCLGTGV